jgi:hypothetical protein
MQANNMKEYIFNLIRLLSMKIIKSNELEVKYMFHLFKNFSDLVMIFMNFIKLP